MRSQTKAFRFLFSEVRLRGGTEPELVHPLFNALKRAWRSVMPNMRDYNTAVLKLCICCNWSHGSYLTAEHHTRKRELLLEFLQAQSPEWMEDFSEELSGYNFFEEVRASVYGFRAPAAFHVM